MIVDLEVSVLKLQSSEICFFPEFLMVGLFYRLQDLTVDAYSVKILQYLMCGQKGN